MKNADVDIASGRGLKAFAVRHQMALFVLLTLIISWSSVIPAKGGLISYGPMIAAFIVLAVVAGRSGVAGLWKQMTRWRVGWKWWLLAPGVLVAVHLCALTINLALGARIVNTAHVESLPVYLVGTALPLILLGGQWEEPGWMGYAQRRHQNRFCWVSSQGNFRCWHHPDDLAYTAAGLWHDPLVRLRLRHTRAADHFTWRYNGAGANVLIVMIAHLFTKVMTATMKPLLSPADQERYWLIMDAMQCLAALCVLIATRGRLGLGPTTTCPEGLNLTLAELVPEITDSKAVIPTSPCAACARDRPRSGFFVHRGANELRKWQDVALRHRKRYDCIGSQQIGARTRWVTPGHPSRAAEIVGRQT